MIVAELIEILKRCPADARVVVPQPGGSDMMDAEVAIVDVDPHPARTRHTFPTLDDALKMSSQTGLLSIMGFSRPTRETCIMFTETGGRLLGRVAVGSWRAVPNAEGTDQ